MLLELGQKIIKAFEKLNDNIVLDDAVIKEVIRDITTALLSADVPIRLISTLRDYINAAIDPQKVASGANKRDLVRNAVIQGLIKLVDPTKPAFQPKKKQTNIVMFVGLQGSGKTTTIAKYAKYYQKKGFKCSLVCGDTFRAGAFEQLQMNAASVRVPFYGDKNETDPVAIARAGVALFKKDGFDLIILDTSGRHKQSEDLLIEMEQMYKSVEPTSVFLVMDSTIGQSAYDQAAAFQKKITIGGVIITKLDGHAKGGGALAAVAATQSPIVFLGTGEGFDALQTFNPSSFVSRLIGGGDIRGMMEKMEDMDIIKKSPELLTNMVSGDFCMSDLKSVLEMFKDAGPISQMMEMMPGNMGRMFEEMKQKTGGGSDQDAAKRMQNFLTIVDSMNAKEMKSTKVFDGPRLMRLARGSGQSMATVENLMASFKMFAKMGTHLKPFLRKGMAPADLANYNPMDTQQKLTPQQMRALQNIIPGNALKNIGGMGGIMNMMKQMSAAKKN